MYNSLCRCVCVCVYVRVILYKWCSICVCMKIHELREKFVSMDVWDAMCCLRVRQMNQEFFLFVSLYIYVRERACVRAWWWFWLWNKILSLHFEGNKVLICKHNKRSSMVGQKCNRYHGEEIEYILIYYGVLCNTGILKWNRFVFGYTKKKLIMMY